MSFKIVDRVRALKDAIQRELANPLELEVNSEEYKFKQKLINCANNEIKELATSMSTLSREWDVTEEMPLSPIRNFENYRDWEGTYFRNETVHVSDTIIRTNYQRKKDAHAQSSSISIES
jgi:hypothetical protein